MKLVTGDQMRAMDKLVIEQYGLPGIVLMENAAIGIAQEINYKFGPLTGRKISIVCGKGNNGGDGIAVARHLVVTYAAVVTIWLAEPMDKGMPDAAVNLMAARNYGIAIESIADRDKLLSELQSSDIVIDAVLGTGIVGNPRPAAAIAIKAINEACTPVVSIDVPSGLNDTGIAGEPTVEADLTVTLVLPKLGLLIYPGAELAGEVKTIDISYPPPVRLAPDVKTEVFGKEDIALLLPGRSATRDSNKGKYGSIAILAGSPGFLGAASLASEAAARTGAGLVTLGVPDVILNPMMIRAVESVMTRGFISSAEGSFGEAAVDSVLEFVMRYDTVGFGPGVGKGNGVSAFARRFIAECDKPLVVDADALTILSHELDHGASIVRKRKAPTVLTPHPGEMARLLGKDTKSVQEDRLTAVRDAAHIFQAVVVLKGQATLVADPDGRLAVNTTGNPGMATGGSGDVLTGIITTLMAQIDDPWKAAVAGVYIHGLSGDLVASENGAAGLLASDIALKMPAAIKACYDKT
jgi:hydroxyethylthiazole kinase-like uncharacterized protein yjeF